MPDVLFTMKKTAVCLILVNNGAWCADLDFVQAYQQILLQQGMQSMFINQPDFSVVFGALRVALSGDAITFARGPIPDVAYVWSTPLLCNDFRKTTLQPIRVLLADLYTYRPKREHLFRFTDVFESRTRGKALYNISDRSD